MIEQPVPASTAGREDHLAGCGSAAKLQTFSATNRGPSPGTLAMCRQAHLRTRAKRCVKPSFPPLIANQQTTRPPWLYYRELPCNGNYPPPPAVITQANRRKTDRRRRRRSRDRGAPRSKLLTKQQKCKHVMSRLNQNPSHRGAVESVAAGRIMMACHTRRPPSFKDTRLPVETSTR